MDGFELLSLEQVKSYIFKNEQLPNIPNAEQIQKEGIDLGAMNAKLLQKIEEMTLYLIEQQSEIEKLRIENEKMKELFKRLDNIETKLNDRSNK